MRPAAAAWLVCAVAAGACHDASPPAACHDIPANGCPEDNGADPCTDGTCAAVYACRNGSWQLDHACPGYSPDSGASPVDAAGDAGPANDAAIDAPPGAFGGPGCPDLQPPDCSLGAALACGGTADCCGCADLYVCVDGGWNLWGSCQDGGVVSSPP